MKKLILFTISTLFSSLIFAQDLTVDQILDKVKDNERIKSSVSKGSQVITTSNGKQRTLEMTSYSKDFSESQLSIYTAPARVAGDKILMLNNGDDIWFYTPKTDRVRHIASSAKKQKVQGSDFSYEDMELWDYRSDFSSKLEGSEKINGVSCYKIEMVPTESGPHYSKMIAWVDKDKFVPLQYDYYEDGEAIKRLSLENMKLIENHWLPMKFTMKSLVGSGFTTIESTQMKVNVELEDNMFTTNYLKQK
ncbi:MAG: outer membrane lipoprotein-sorting protein [Bacteroidetes bacterium]|nr:outer membrane lipoprotein-sorting protein [Bacteroidota bacterium]